MPAEMGEFLGYLIIICYALAVLNYFVKFINKRFRNTLSKNKKFYAIYMQIMKFIIKRHKIFDLRQSSLSCSTFSCSLRQSA